MNNVVIDSGGRACSGCGACTAICPKGAIRLQMDSAGFLEPVIQENLCIHCGLCKKVCQRFSVSAAQPVSLYDSRLYALRSTSELTVRESSSGGICAELAKIVIDNGGKAVGCRYCLDTDRAEHAIAVTQDEAEAFAGSKYIQSDPSLAFRQILQEAKGDSRARFLVTGTPCQIRGLSMAASVLGVRDRFLLAEIFCHGVPPYSLWEEECRRIRRKLGAKRFDSVVFRHKKHDWHSYCLRVQSGYCKFFGYRERLRFWHVYFENILLGDACYSCDARKTDSWADIRLGDYWGRAFSGDTNGVSAVFACTQRGTEAVEALISAGRVETVGETDIAEMLAAQNMAGYQSTELHQQTMEVLRKEGLHPAIRFYRRRLGLRHTVKRWLLHITGLLPGGLRVKLRKTHSNLRLKK